MEQKGYRISKRTKYSNILGSFFYLHYLISTNTVYTHPTSSGNKHIPSGGSAGQILRWSSDGTAVWGSDNNTTYGTGTSSASGLTKLYGGTGSATDGTMTQSAITSALNGKAASSHTHLQTDISGLNDVLLNTDSRNTKYLGDSDIDTYSSNYAGSFNQVFGHSNYFNNKNYGFWTCISSMWVPSGNASGQLAINSNGGIASRFYIGGAWSDWKSPFDSLCTIPDGSNMDSYTTPGVYQLGGDSYTNCPCHWGLMVVFNASNAYVMQLIIDAAGTMSTRAHAHDKGWSAWHIHDTYKSKAHT